MAEIVRLHDANTVIELAFVSRLTRPQIARALRMAARRIQAYVEEAPDDGLLRGHDGQPLLEVVSTPAALLP